MALNSPPLEYGLEVVLTSSKYRMAKSDEISLRRSGYKTTSVLPDQYSSKLSRSLKTRKMGFPGGAVVKNPPANAGDTGWSPGPGRSHMPQSN